MNGDTNGKIEHIVEVGDDIEVKLKIPYRLTAMELKALSMKANKLFGLSDVPLAARRTTSGTRPTNRRLFTEEMTEDVRRLRKSGMIASKVAEELNKKYGTSLIDQNIYGLMYRVGIK